MGLLEKGKTELVFIEYGKEWFLGAIVQNKVNINFMGGVELKFR